MDWLALVRDLRAARCAAYAGQDRVGGSITAQTTDDEYRLRIIGPINWWFGVDVLEVATELMVAQPDRVSLYIDSPGGDLFDAMALRAALDTVSAHGSTIVSTTGALVASAAVPIYLSGLSRLAQDFTRFMVHSPRGVLISACTVTTLDKTVQDFRSTLEAATDMYWSSLSNHVAPETVETWRRSDGDTWLTVEQARTHGLVTVEEPAEPAEDEQLDARYMSAIRDCVRATLQRGGY